MSYGSEFEPLITQAGFTLEHLEPQITPAKADHIYKVDQGKKIGYMFSVGEVETQVRNKLALTGKRNVRRKLSKRWCRLHWTRPASRAFLSAPLGTDRRRWLHEISVSARDFWV
jgi:hypothetical protein